MNVGGFGNGVVFFFTFALFVFLPPSFVCVCVFRKEGRKEGRANGVRGKD